MPFQMHISPFFGEVISRYSVIPDPQIQKVLTERLPTKTIKELQPFFGIINYLGKLYPGTTDVNHSKNWHHQEESWPGIQHIWQNKVNCKRSGIFEILWWTQANIHKGRCIWGWNGSYPATNKKQYKLCHRWSPDSSILRPITFVSKSHSSIEKRYNNIERGTEYIIRT